MQIPGVNPWLYETSLYPTTVFTPKVGCLTISKDNSTFNFGVLIYDLSVRQKDLIEVIIVPIIK